jgi:hypothetical protein
VGLGREATEHANAMQTKLDNTGQHQITVPMRERNPEKRSVRGLAISRFPTRIDSFSQIDLGPVEARIDRDLAIQLKVLVL